MAMPRVQGRGAKAALRTVIGMTAAMTALCASGAALADTLGMPTDKAIGLQPSGDALRDQAQFFHNVVLLPTITAISIFVLVLLAVVVVKFNRRANPTPAKFSHNTPLEIAWTIIPVGILAAIAAFSFPLLFAYHDMPKPDVVIKATGNQWYWSYEYPDLKVPEYTSNILPEDKAGDMYKLAATDPIVVPVGKTVKVLVTGADVLHAFFVPAFGVQTTAVPGRINEVWFQTRKTGKYYGQCNELCGVDHSFMPIEVDVVSQAEFDAWVAKRAKPAAPAAEAAAPAAATPAAAPAAAPAPPAPASGPAAAPAKA